jgi:hypothetical protein
MLIRPTVKLTSYWKCTTSEITNSFHASTIVFNVRMKMTVGSMQLLNKFSKTSEDQETDENDTTKYEQVTNQDARKFTAGL